MIILVGLNIKDIDIHRNGLEEQGIATYAVSDVEFCDWFQSLDLKDKSAIESILIGDCATKYKAINLIKSKSTIPAIAINSSADTDSMLNLFLSGADDVISVHAQPREIVARVGAIRRRAISQIETISIGLLHVYFDGRDPEINGEAIKLPRRERRILEYLAANTARRVSRSMIFDAVYGLFEAEVEESVVESHISKLRKKLKSSLGFDPIDNQRYIGYQFVQQTPIVAPGLNNSSIRIGVEKLRSVSCSPTYHEKDENEILAA